MKTQHPLSGNDTGLPAAKVANFLSRVQEDTAQRRGFLEGIDILHTEQAGQNACYSLIQVALEKVKKIDTDLDSVNWAAEVAKS